MAPGPVRRRDLVAARVVPYAVSCALACVAPPARAIKGAAELDAVYYWKSLVRGPGAALNDATQDTEGQYLRESPRGPPNPRVARGVVEAGEAALASAAGLPPDSVRERVRAMREQLGKPNVLGMVAGSDTYEYVRNLAAVFAVAASEPRMTQPAVRFAFADRFGTAVARTAGVDPKSKATADNGDDHSAGGRGRRGSGRGGGDVDVVGPHAFAATTPRATETTTAEGSPGSGIRGRVPATPTLMPRAMAGAEAVLAALAEARLLESWSWLDAGSLAPLSVDEADALGEAISRGEQWDVALEVRGSPTVAITSSAAGARPLELVPEPAAAAVLAVLRHTLPSQNGGQGPVTRVLLSDLVFLEAYRDTTRLDIRELSTVVRLSGGS